MEENKLDKFQGFAYATPDILRRVFDFLVDAQSLATASGVCKYWRSAYDHESVWRSLSYIHRWPNRGKRWFIHHFASTRNFVRTSPKSDYLKAASRAAGIQMLCSPKPQSSFDWRLGKYVTSNEQLVISGSSAPDFKFSVWETNTQKRIREFAVFQNPRVKTVQAPPSLPFVAPPSTSANDDEDGDNKEEVDITSMIMSSTPSNSSSSSSSNSSSSNSNLHDQKEVAVHTPPTAGAAPQAGATAEPTQASGSVYQWSAAHIDGTILFFSTAQPSLLVADFTQSTNPSLVSPRLRIANGHASTITAVHCNERHMIGASVSYDRHMRLWDLKSGSLLRDYAFSLPCWCVEINSDGHTVACGSDDGFVYVYDNDGLVAKLREHKLKAPCIMVATFAPTLGANVLCAGGYDSVIKIWDFRAQQLLRTLEGHRSVVFSIQVLEHVLVSGSRDETVRLWDPFSGQFLRQLSMDARDIKAVVCLSESKFAAAGLRDQTIHTWDFAPSGLTNVSGDKSGKTDDCNLM